MSFRDIPCHVARRHGSSGAATEGGHIASGLAYTGGEMASSKFRCTAAAAATAIVITFVIGPSPRAQVSSQGLIQAPGGPIVDCVGGPARVLRLEGVVAEQRRMLDRTRELLRKAEGGNAEATQATEEAILEQAKDFAKDQITLIRTVRAMREAGLSAEQRRRILTLTERIQETVEQIDEAKDRVQMLSALTRNTSDWQSLMSVLDESGLGDEAATALSGAFGPVGPAVVKGLIIARDLLYVGIEQRLSDQELAQARHNNAVLENAVRLQQDKIDRLRGLMADNCPKAGQQPGPPSSAKPIPPQNVAVPAAEPAPPPEAAASTPAVKKGSGKLLSLGLGLGGATIGAWFLGKELGKLDTGDEGSGSGSGSGTGSGSGSARPTLVSPGQWICRNSTRECSATVTINFPMTLHSGFATVMSSPDAWRGQSARVSVTSPPGNVPVTLTRPFNFCYGPQTSLAIWDAQTADGQNTYAITGLNMPVSCQ